MGNWKTYKLGDLVTFQRGHDLTKSQMQEGSFPVVGSNGVIGFHNEYTTKAPSITIGRSGNIGNAYFFDKDFWAHNTTLYIKEFKNCDPKFIYYLLQTINFGGHNSGSAVPSLNRNYIHPIEIQAPDLGTQVEIAKILSSLDDKIELLKQMNQTLENIAQAIFKEWFVDFNFPGFDDELVDGLPKGWRMGKLGEILELLYGKALKADTRVSGKYPVIGSSGIVDYHNKFLVEAPGIVIGRKGTIGEVIWIDENFFPIDTTFYIRDLLGVAGLYFHYFLLKEQEFKKIASDSAVPGLNRNQGMDNIVTIPNIEIVMNFNSLIQPVFLKKAANSNQIQTLTQTRDTLLPKLMSGNLEIN